MGNSKDKLVEWNAAVAAFNDSKIKDALGMFCAISDMSKLHFNIGVCCINLFDYEKAEMAFSKAIEADPYFGIAFYQRGWVYTRLKQYSKALKDYIQAYQSLRKNLFINYSQIGLEFQLEAADIVINAGLCTVLLNDASKAKVHFKKGIQTGDSERKKICQRAIELGAEAPKEIPFRYASVSLIFVPQTDEISTIQEFDYLGTSTVISENKDDLVSEDFLFDYISESADSPTISAGPLLPPRSSSNHFTFSPKSPVRTSNQALLQNSTIIASMSSTPPTDSAIISSTSLRPRNRDRSNTDPLTWITAAGSRTKPRVQSASNGLPPNMHKSTSQQAEHLGVKVIYGTMERAMKVPRDVAFRDLALQIQNDFDLDISFKVGYKDQCGDNVVITDDEDFGLCVHTWRGSNRGGEVELYVID